MNLTRLTVMVAALAVTTGTVAMAEGPAIKPITKSTQAAPVPPTPPWITAVFGENATLAFGAVGAPGTVVGTVLIGGVVFFIIVIDSDSSTTT